MFVHSVRLIVGGFVDGNIDILGLTVEHTQIEQTNLHNLLKSNKNVS